jgi:hypothetical protein
MSFAESVRKRPGMYFGDPKLPRLVQVLLKTLLSQDRPDWDGRLALSIRNSKTTSILTLFLADYRSVLYDPAGNLTERFTLGEGNVFWEIRPSQPFLDCLFCKFLTAKSVSGSP